MGVDVTLLPFYSNNMPNDLSPMAHSVIELNRNQDAFFNLSELLEAHGVEVERGLFTYLARGEDGESTYGLVKNDPYGSPLVAIRAEFLKGVYLGDGWKSKAASAFIGELPDDLMIAVYWS